MGFLKNLLAPRPVEGVEGLPEGTKRIDNGDGSESFLIPTASDGAAGRKVFGRIHDSEGRSWEVSAGANTVFLYDVDENEYVFFDALGGSDLLRMLGEAVGHAHGV